MTEAARGFASRQPARATTSGHAYRQHASCSEGAYLEFSKDETDNQKHDIEHNAREPPIDDTIPLLPRFISEYP
jgi:hypothetical protein